MQEAIAGLSDTGFVGANVTTPHKLAVRELCETDLPSVNTLFVREGIIKGYSTDAAILEGFPPSAPAVIGDGGSAAASGTRCRK